MPDIVTCKNCGKETHKGQPQCFRCGAIGYEEDNPKGHEFAPGHRLPPEPVEITKEQEAQFSIKSDWLHIELETARLHPLFGPDGWIRFFQFVLFVGPILGLGYGLVIASNVSSRYTNSVLFNLIIDFCFLFWAWWLATELAKPQAQSIRYVYIYLSAGIALGFVTVIIAANLDHQSFRRVGSILISHVIRDIFVAMVWALYFTHSKRVNVTYRHRVKLADPFVKTLSINLSNIPHRETWSQKAGYHAAELAYTASDTVAPQVKDVMKAAANGVANTVSSLQKQAPVAADNFSSRLAALKKALDDGLITEADYEEKKKSVLNDL